MNQNQLLTPDQSHVANIQFKKGDVLNSAQEKNERLKKLISALAPFLCKNSLAVIMIGSPSWIELEKNVSSKDGR